MNIKNGFLAALLLVILGVGCNQVDFKRTKSGLAYKLFPGNGKDTAGMGYVIKFNIKQVYHDSDLGNTYKSMPAYAAIQDLPAGYQIDEVFRGRRKGDSLWIVQSIDSFLRQNPQGLPPFLKPGTNLYTGIKILEVFKNRDDAQKDREKEMQAFEKNQDKLFVDYVAKNKIEGKKTESGVIVQITKAGTGPVAAVGKTLFVKYRGTTLEGKEFDSNMDSTKHGGQLLPVPLGQGGTVKGFEEGLLQLREGDRAKLFIPQTVGYGANPPSNDIKPFEHLIFEIEVVRVEDTPKMPDTTAVNPGNRPQLRNR